MFSFMTFLTSPPVQAAVSKEASSRLMHKSSQNRPKTNYLIPLVESSAMRQMICCLWPCSLAVPVLYCLMGLVHFLAIPRFTESKH